MDFSAIQPFVRCVSLSPYFWHNDRHTMAYDARLFYIYRGTGTVTVNKTENYTLYPGNLFVFQPGVIYNFDCVDDEPFYMLIVNFDFDYNYSHKLDYISNSFEGLFDPKLMHKSPELPVFNEPVFIEDMSSIETKLFSMLQEYQLQPLLFRDRLSCSFKDILIDIARELDKKTTSLSSPVVNLINFIHLHHAEDVTYEMISEAFSYHPYYLNRIFKQETGKTIGQYIQEYKLTVASQLLSSTIQPIEEITYLSGFKNASHFSACFKKHFGCSPKDFRKNSSQQ